MAAPSRVPRGECVFEWEVREKDRQSHCIPCSGYAA